MHDTKMKRSKGDFQQVKKMVPIPNGVKLGAIIGRGGSTQKKLSSDHGVRSHVDARARSVVLEGERDGIEAATDELLRMFEHVQIRQSSRSFIGDSRGKVYQNAVKHGNLYSWCFRKDLQPGGDQPNPDEYAYVMQKVESLPQNTDANSTNSWVRVFDRAFISHMQGEMKELSPTIDSPIKIKAALGTTKFRLRSSRPDNAMGWTDIQALMPFRQINMRWTNGCNSDSDSVSQLVDRLERLARSSARQAVLTTFVSQGSGKPQLTFKFHGKDGKWAYVPKNPCRVAHRLYSITLDDDTGFRVRVFSRESTANTSMEYLHDCITIVGDGSAYPFDARAELSEDAPEGFEIFSSSVKEKVHVRYNGLRFTLEYGNAAHTDVRLECRFDGASRGTQELPHDEIMKGLIDNLLDALGHSDL